MLLMHSVEVFGVLSVRSTVCVYRVPRRFLEVDAVGVSKYGDAITRLAKCLAPDLHVGASRKNEFAKSLEVFHEDTVVDSSLVDSVGWWVLQFRGTGEEVTTLYTDEMGIHQERTDWAQLGELVITAPRST
jgi:hypothetical protein